MRISFMVTPDVLFLWVLQDYFCKISRMPCSVFFSVMR